MLREKGQDLRLCLTVMEVRTGRRDGNTGDTYVVDSIEIEIVCECRLHGS